MIEAALAAGLLTFANQSISSSPIHSLRDSGEDDHDGDFASYFRPAQFARSFFSSLSDDQESNDQDDSLDFDYFDKSEDLYPVPQIPRLEVDDDDNGGDDRNSDLNSSSVPPPSPSKFLFYFIFYFIFFVYLFTFNYLN